MPPAPTAAGAGADDMWEERAAVVHDGPFCAAGHLLPLLWVVAPRGCAVGGLRWALHSAGVAVAPHQLRADGAAPDFVADRWRWWGCGGGGPAARSP
eukprot:gene7560-9044_t